MTLLEKYKIENTESYLTTDLGKVIAVSNNKLF